MSEIFVSYSSLDRDRIAPLVEALRHQGWVIWWDRAILPGQNWDEEIEHRLKAATCVVVIWTAASVESEWVRLEAGIARERRKLVPVRFDDVQPPLTFSQLQTASLLGWDNSETAPGFIELMRGISGLVEAAQPVAPALPLERERTLDAAIARELRVEEAANLIAMVRLPESAGLKAILDADDEFGVSPSDVSSRSFDLTFPAGPGGGPVPVDLTLKIDSPKFDPPSQAKKIRVNPTRDSTVCSFLLTPLVPGRLVVQLEVYQNDIALVSRVLRVSGVPVGVTVASPAYQVTSLPLAVTVKSPAFAPSAVLPPVSTLPASVKKRSLAPWSAGIAALALLALVPAYLVQYGSRGKSGQATLASESTEVVGQFKVIAERARVTDEKVASLSRSGVALGVEITASRQELEATLKRADQAIKANDLKQAAELIYRASVGEQHLASSIQIAAVKPNLPPGEIQATRLTKELEVVSGRAHEADQALSRAEGPIHSDITASQLQLKDYLEESRKAMGEHDLKAAEKMLDLAGQAQLKLSVQIKARTGAQLAPGK